MDDATRLVHSVDTDTDVEMAIALGVELRGECGATFVPKYADGRLAGLSECPDCFPQSRRRPGSHRTPIAIRQAFPHYVYRFYDVNDRLLYVGCSYNPPSRFRSHRTEAKWFGAVVRTRLVVFPNRRKALDMERLAIETERPLHNLQFNRSAS